MNIETLKRQNIVVKLIAVNVIVFLILNIIKIVFHLTIVEADPQLKEIAVNVKLQPILEFISVPATLKGLLTRFWTPITYMFVQVDFFHILGNMLWLFFLGTMLVRYLKESDFLALYFAGGVAGAVLYIIAYNIFPIFSSEKIFSILLGASASVTAIVVAMATLKPNEEVYFFGLIKIKLKYIAIALLIYDIFLLKGDNAGGHFAHLGGAIYGFIYGQQFKKGNNFSAAFANFLGRLFGMEKPIRKKTKFKVVKNSMKEKKNTMKIKDDYEYNSKVTDNNAEIDRILEKISRYGYKYLSNREKEFLKKHGKNYK